MYKAAMRSLCVPRSEGNNGVGDNSKYNENDAVGVETLLDAV